MLIQDASSVKAVRKYLRAPKTSDLVRPKAVAVYSMLTNESAGLSYIGKLITDDAQEEAIRQEAARAYGRLVHKKKELGPLNKTARTNNTTDLLIILFILLFVRRQKFTM